MKQYVVYAKLWFSFALQGLTPTIRNIVEFLTYLHSKGYSHDQISAARSAVGVISNEENIGKHPDIKRLMKGIFEKNPHFPRYSSVWDVRILLDYFSKLPHQRTLSLRLLTKKLATLIGILAGGQRSQTIHVNNVMDIVVTGEKCIIPIYNPIKQTKKGKHMKPLEFKVFCPDEKLCVVHNLTTYLMRTKNHRRSPYLFLSYQSPFHHVTKDSVTRWINDTMSSAGIDIQKYVTHSCRAAASSFALKRNIPLKIIMDSCGWSSSSTFANHYKKTIVETTTIGQRILEG